MMIRKYFFAVAFLLIVAAFKSYGQDPTYSQFYANPLYLNPALAGSALSHRAIANYRNQWPSLSANFVTYNVSYEHYLGGINSTFALLANMDRTAGGAFNASNISLIYTYSLQASLDWFVNFSVQAGVTNRHLVWEKLQFEDAIHPVYGLNYYATVETPPDKASIWNPDFSVGIVSGYKDILYGGIAVHHLAEPYDGLYNRQESRLYRKYTGHLGGNINLSQNGTRWNAYKNARLSPAVIYQQQLDFTTLCGGLYFDYYPIIAGAWYRCNFDNPDAVILILGLQFNNFKLGYSYDITMSRLANVSGGAHEVSLSYTFGEQWSRSTQRQKRGIPCPHF